MAGRQGLHLKSGDQQRGNKGGGRLGYEFEKDQLVRMRKAVDRALWTIEAIQKGKITDVMLNRYQKIQPTLLKLIDKLHASKQENTNNLNVNLTIGQVLDELDDGRTIEGQTVENVPLIQDKEQG
jgi:hypothetical protein